MIFQPPDYHLAIPPDEADATSLQRLAYPRWIGNVNALINEPSISGLTLSCLMKEPFVNAVPAVGNVGHVASCGAEKQRSLWAANSKLSVSSVEHMGERGKGLDSA